MATMPPTAGLVIIALLICAALAVVVWWAWDPGNADRMEEDARIPINPDPNEGRTEDDREA